MSYPTLATGTIVERKGDDATDRKAHLVIDHDAPQEPKEEVKDEPEETVEEPVKAEVSEQTDDHAG
jgi:hypothetical protein